MNLQTSAYNIENKWIISSIEMDNRFLKIQNSADFERDEKLNFWIIKPTLENRTLLRSVLSEAEFAQVPEIKNERTVISIETFDKHIILKMPKNEVDVSFVRFLKYSAWSKQWYHWKIPNYPGNLELILAHFRGRIDRYTQHQTVVETHGENRVERKTDEVVLFLTQTKRIRILAAYHLGLMQFVKKIPYHSWDSANKWWSIPYSEEFLRQLEFALKQMALSFRVEQEEPRKNSDAAQKKTPFDSPHYKTCPEEMLLKIQELRYSKSTLKTYKSAFEDFINYHNSIALQDLNEGHIQTFLRHLVMERQVSISYQNQAINAVKFYFEKVLHGARKTYFIDRPKKEKSLPNVLSTEEVSALLKSIENLKHKAILSLIYSAGLRISECINMRIKDIDSQRMQIRVEQSKGKKDRYTILSPKTLGILRAYFLEYRPKEYLFEGPTEAKYSARSIQVIFHRAAQAAKITKKVSVHTLRHSFATHLLENGVGLRYIQNLLGHENSKTTEIYTHITTKGLDQIKSPFDTLDF